MRWSGLYGVVVAAMLAACAGGEVNFPVGDSDVPTGDVADGDGDRLTSDRPPTGIGDGDESTDSSGDVGDGLPGDDTDGDSSGDVGDDGDTDDGGPSTPDPDELDNHPDDASIPLGEVCRRSGQCETDFCARISAETNDGWCTRLCQEDSECPEDWQCVLIASSGVDRELVCIDPSFCIDRDGDGFGVGPGCLGPDCDDTDPTVYPGAPELCDGKDNSCNGIVDDRPIGEGEDCSSGNSGFCAAGRTVCRSGEMVCESINAPQIEVCNGQDMNCDGVVDSGNPGGGQPCPTGLPGACGTGETQCVDGEIVCVTLLEPGEQDEICNGRDMNCDGTIDTGFDNLGQVCFAGLGNCARAGGYGCDPDDPTAEPICFAATGEPAAVEQCNYQDDNCDGVVDGGFRDEDGFYGTVEHCGACNLNCNNFWPGGPDLYNVNPVCTVQGGMARCGFECIGGYVDADGAAENGCELLPDAGAIYVSRPANGGSDTGTCGSWDAPCATIGHGISRAQSAERERVRVSDGVFRESVTLVNGVSLLGGHNNANWARNPEIHVSLINGTGGPGNDRVAVTAQNISQRTELSGFIIQSENAGAGGNSTGVYVRNASAELVIEDNQILPGRGGDGASGNAGTPGTNGAVGGGGRIRSVQTSCGTPPAPGAGGARTCANLRTGETVNVSGGAGGTPTCPQSTSNRTGSGANGQGGNGGTGGLGPGNFTASGSTCIVNPSMGVDAVPGSPGGAGANGNRGTRSTSSQGTVSGGVWRGASGGDGQAGLPGSGGGGGSAAAGLYYHDSGGLYGSSTTYRYFGASGGGGGSGGCGGDSGRGGGGGGGSFAIFVSQDQSTAEGQMPIIRRNVLTRGEGGGGGSGGTGGPGGESGVLGAGGPAATGGSQPYDFCMLAAGDGAPGGRGGHGGGGAGGNGGASFDIFLHNGAPRDAYDSANEFTRPASENTAGAGGTGGNSSNTASGVGESGTAGPFGRITSI